MCAPKQLKACASRNARPTKYEIGSTLADTGVQYGWAVERHLKDGESKTSSFGCRTGTVPYQLPRSSSRNHFGPASKSSACSYRLWEKKTLFIGLQMVANYWLFHNGSSIGIGDAIAD
ncbi:hypothetical protein MKEN_00007100 [Mycena kentingensis (nom. inval.)]|nr:hypothetical protein MKEN_00007100 [Mycena kentingensis (nom. inval.)]